MKSKKGWKSLPGLYLSFLLSLLFSFGANAQSPAAAALADIREQLNIAEVLNAPADSYSHIGESFLAFESRFGASLDRNPQLKKDFVRTKRLAAIQARFKTCLKRFGVENSLGRRILAAAFSIDPDSFECGDDQRTMSDMLSDMEGPRKAMNQLSFRRNLSFHLRRNMATNMAAIDYQVTDEIPEDMSHRDWGRQVRDRVLNQVCPENSCTASERERLRSDITSQLTDNMRNGVRPMSTETVSNRMETDVQEINNILTDNVYVLDTPEHASGRNKTYDDKRERAKELAADQYADYLATYWENTSHGYGVLFHTEDMKDKIGAPREFDADDINKKGHQNIYTIDAKPHEASFNSRDVQKAKLDYMQNMSEILEQDRSDMARIARGGRIDVIEANLKAAIQDYPLAAAQALLENPDSAKDICELINDIEDKDEASSKMTATRRILLSISGGALMVGGLVSSFTGIGASWGVPMMIAGAALTSTEVAASTYDYLSAQSQLDELVRSQLSGSGDQANLLTEMQLRDASASAAFDVAATVGLTATGVGIFLKRARDVSQLTGVAALGERGVQTLRRFEATGDLSRMRRTMPQSQYAEVMADLVNAPPQMQLEMMREIRRVNTAGGNANDYRRIQESAQEALEQTCRR